MFEVEFYRLICKADDAILVRSRELEQSKAYLAELEAEALEETSEEISYKGTDRLIEDTRVSISEAYLALDAGHALRAELADLIEKVRLLSAFVDHRYDNETFNLLYEEQVE